MINGIQGIPGSGKSYEACLYHLLPAIRSGRKVITNLPVNVEQLKILCPDTWHLLEVRTQAAPIRGAWNASNLAVSPAFQFYPNNKITLPSKQSPFSSVWCFYSEWKDAKGVGALYIIDECQVSFPRSGTDKSVQEWFQLHRHYNADVVLISQNFRQVDPVITGLLANLIICRKADILGDSGSYIRKVKAGFRGEVIQSDRRKYEPQYFSLYKSHTQSSSSSETGSNDVKPRGVFLRRLTYIYWIFALSFLAWSFWPEKKSNPSKLENPIIEDNKPVIKPVIESIPSKMVDSSKPVVAAKAPEVSEPINKEENKKDEKFGVLDDKFLHVLGNMVMGDKRLVLFEVSDGQRRLFQVDLDGLQRSGYKVKIFDTCLVEVTSPSGKPRAVLCDSPSLPSHDARRPLVIDRASGASSWDRSDYKPYRAAAESGSL